MGAEVLRKARALWPLSTKDADRTVTVRIDALKELEMHSVFCPDHDLQYVIAKTSNNEAVVKLMGIEMFQDLEWRNHQILNLRSTKRRTSVMDRKSYAMPVGGLTKKASNLSGGGSPTRSWSGFAA